MNSNPVSEKPVILASSSPYRAELLRRILPEFDCVSPNVDETPMPHEPPGDLALRLGEAKAERVAQDHPEAIIIGSDQVCVGPEGVLGKPGDRASAEAQLALLSEQRVEFLTSITVLAAGKIRSELVITAVTFRQLTRDEIGRYLDREPALDCAGSFKAEALGITLFERIESDDPTALIGLPLIATANLLRGLGIALP